MLLGILSDTHDRPAAMRVGVETLQQAGVEYIIHCGDIGGEAVLDLLSGINHAAVWGNNDYDRHRLGHYARTIGVQVHEPFAQLQLGGKRIVVTHGDDPALLRRVVRDKSADYILFGHTHVPSDERINGVRVINPGALHRANPKTVATLDLATDRLRHIVVQV